MATLSDLIEVGIARETTPGTPQAIPSGHWMPWNAFAVAIEGDFKLLQEHRVGTRYKNINVVKGPEYYRVTIEGNVNYYTFAKVLSALNSNVTTTVDTPEVGVNTHSLALETNLRTYTIAVIDPVVGSRNYPHGILDRLSLSIESGGLATFSSEWVTKKPAAVITSSSYLDQQIGASSVNATVTIGGNTYKVTNLTLEFSENAQAVIGLGNDTISGGAKGQREETITATVVADSTTLYDAFRNNTNQAVTVTITFDQTIGTSTNPKVEFSWSNAYITALEEVMSVGELITYEIEIKPVLTPVGITVVNDWSNADMTS